MVRAPRTWGWKRVFLIVRKSTNFLAVGQESELSRWFEGVPTEC